MNVYKARRHGLYLLLIIIMYTSQNLPLAASPEKNEETTIPERIVFAHNAEKDWHEIRYLNFSYGELIANSCLMPALVCLGTGICAYSIYSDNQSINQFILLMSISIGFLAGSVYAASAISLLQLLKGGMQADKETVFANITHDDITISDTEFSFYKKDIPVQWEKIKSVACSDETITFEPITGDVISFHKPKSMIGTMKPVYNFLKEYLNQEHPGKILFLT